MRTGCAAVFAALIFFWWAGVAAAQDVALTSRDGNVSVTGTLLTYDGELYRIQTEYGVLTLDGFRVTCDGSGCPDLTALVSNLRISGSRTMGEVLMPALVETYAARKGLRAERLVLDDTHFEYRLSQLQDGADFATIQFRVTSSAEGFADLVADEADLVLSTREVTPAEVRLGKEAGIGDLTVARRSKIVALDGLVPIVARRSSQESISLETLARVASGEVTDWSELGEERIGAIRFHLRSDQSGLAEEFVRRVLDPMGLQLRGDAVRHDDNASLADAVAGDPGAIGVAAFSELGNAKPLGLTGGCGKQVLASAATLKTEDYPLTTPLFIYSPIGRPSPLERDFIGYIRSSAAQPVIARSGVVDLRVGEVVLDRQGLRLANAIQAAGTETSLGTLQNMVAAMDQTARLTLSYRFESGGTRLDAQSRSNIELLANQLEQGRFDGRVVMFVGFTDGEGPADANRRLARRRAETVRRAVLRAAPAADRNRLTIQVEAFGEALPMACDDAEWGRGINRRVEVWVK